MADILYVDDSQDSRELFEAMFQLEGFTVECCRSGADALIWLHENQPKVIVLDLAMPILDGVTTVHEIRRSERIFQRTPAKIAFLTGAVVDDTIQRIAKQHGVTSVFEKTKDPWENVVEKIKSWLVN